VDSVSNSQNPLNLKRHQPKHPTATLYTMRLITHNLLACHAAPGGKACVSPFNFPLNFQDVTKMELSESEINPEFLRGFVNKLDWNALVVASRQVRKQIHVLLVVSS